MICKSRVQDIWCFLEYRIYGVCWGARHTVCGKSGTRLAKDTAVARITSCALLKLTIAQYTFPISDT